MFRRFFHWILPLNSLERIMHRIHIEVEHLDAFAHKHSLKAELHEAKVQEHADKAELAHATVDAAHRLKGQLSTMLTNAGTDVAA